MKESIYKNIIFDLAGTLFFDSLKLAPGAVELLDYCKAKQINMIAVTSGPYYEDFIHQIGLDKYLSHVKCLEGLESKTPELFDQVMQDQGMTPQDTIGIGDLLNREIRSLGMLGVTTIWINNYNKQLSSDDI